ncbi:hypothetical protein IAQ61_009733 [Plenodomus lingam]|uniref:Predicted protein n=1 Tax=Leptosphaeria maculans (strain JN3 / isolate v23.1.3 / race Av1-4-5-6-7-8) TaxID=985895 RepID=E4ZUT6_LEPMJ|nr:predicted protein [Plenodomus lingam JN3]KAH9863455.1 hypothetical protein IAQ61_009733 [Plenodomus lingam]CBX95165.1 predicted protein [Plenodomus lingam JN3]
MADCLKLEKTRLALPEGTGNCSFGMLQVEAAQLSRPSNPPMTAQSYAKATFAAFNKQCMSSDARKTSKIARPHWPDASKLDYTHRSEAVYPRKSLMANQQQHDSHKPCQQNEIRKHAQSVHATGYLWRLQCTGLKILFSGHEKCMSYLSSNRLRTTVDLDKGMDDL